MLDFCLAIKKAFFPVGYFFNLPNSWPCNPIVINPLHLHQPLHLKQLQKMRIQFGAIVVAGAGKAGGTIIQRGRYGQVLRNLTVPKSSKLPASQAPRAAMSTVSSNWRLLTVNERIGWNTLADTLTRFNKFGVSYIPTGYQVFCELNLNLVNIPKLPILNAAPAPPVFPNITDWALDALPTGPSVILTWTNLSSQPNWSVGVSFYPLQTFGASVPRGSARQVPTNALVSAESLDLSDAFTQTFGVPAGGVYQLAIRVVVIESTTGYRMPDLVLMVPFLTP